MRKDHYEFGFRPDYNSIPRNYEELDWIKREGELGTDLKKELELETHCIERKSPVPMHV